MANDSYTLHENIAALSSLFHAHAGLNAWVEKEQEGFSERMRMLIETAEYLTRLEPDDYEEVGLDWYLVTDEIVDLLHKDVSPEDAVTRALQPQLAA